MQNLNRYLRTVTRNKKHNEFKIDPKHMRRKAIPNDHFLRGAGEAQTQGCAVCSCKPRNSRDSLVSMGMYNDANRCFTESLIFLTSVKSLGMNVGWDSTNKGVS